MPKQFQFFRFPGWPPAGTTIYPGQVIPGSLHDVEQILTVGADAISFDPQPDGTWYLYLTAEFVDDQHRRSNLTQLMNHFRMTGKCTLMYDIRVWKLHLTSDELHELARLYQPS